MKLLFLFVKGMAVGGANVVPGVSGATLAVILKIYDDLIGAVNGLFSNMTKSLRFLIPVGLGMVAGILATGGAIDFFLTRFSMQTGGFIAGLMAGSLPFIYHQCVRRTATTEDTLSGTRILSKQDSATIAEKPPVSGFILAAVSAAFLILLTLFAPSGSNGGEYTGVSWDFSFAAHLFIGGLFAAATMVVPGISGAMVLMLFGLYPVAMHTISNMRHFLASPGDTELLFAILAVLLPLGVGIVVGILLGSRLIALLLAKFHSKTYFVILGLIFGTIFVIFNDSATYQSHAEITPILVLFTAIAFIGGTAVSMVLGRNKAV